MVISSASFGIPLSIFVKNGCKLLVRSRILMNKGVSFNKAVPMLLTTKSVETNKLGRFDIPQLANGICTIVLTAQGFKTVTMNKFEVKTGVYNTLNVAMEKMEAVV
jgi:hypothetical protein